MRHDPVDPELLVLDLLARADRLALEASLALEAGDDARLSDLLDDRGVAIDAASAAARAASAGVLTADVTTRLATAMRTTIASGDMLRSRALRSRNEVVAELAALESRQLASQEYLPDTPHGSIDVVL